MSALQQTSITPEQYLEIEFQADHKSEYFAGQMYAMAGALPARVLLVTNPVGELGADVMQCLPRVETRGLEEPTGQGT